MLSVSLQEITQENIRTLLAVREESIVRAVVRLIAERLPELVEEPPEWFKLLQQEGEDDEDRR